jgi:hypothetical protein
MDYNANATASLIVELDALQNECNELRKRNASLEDIKERYESLMKRYMDLDKKYVQLLDQNSAMKYVIKDLDRDSSCGKCMYKNYYHYDSKYHLLSTEGEHRRGKLPTFTDHLIDEVVEKYEFLKGLLTLVFFISPIVLSWNYGAIYLLLFIPLLVVRLLPSEETVKVFLVDYYKRKENE